jgi:hypothetical protein
MSCAPNAERRWSSFSQAPRLLNTVVIQPQISHVILKLLSKAKQLSQRTGLFRPHESSKSYYHHLLF